MSTPAINLGKRTVLALSGGDRERYINGQVSNDVRKLTGENAMAACVTTIKGKLDALVYITVIGDVYLIDSELELRDSLHARLGKYIIADDCELQDVSDAWKLVHVLGSFESEHTTRASERLGQPGTDLWLPAATPIPDTLEILTPSAAEEIRICNGVPEWGAELTPDTLPAEAGLDATAIDFHKGCYIGQEVISRIKSVGRVNRSLVRLLISGDPPEPGAQLFIGEKEVGTVTSIAPPHALGYVKRDHLNPGTRLSLTPTEKNLSTTLEIVDSQQA